MPLHGKREAKNQNPNLKHHLDFHNSCIDEDQGTSLNFYDTIHPKMHERTD